MRTTPSLLLAVIVCNLGCKHSTVSPSTFDDTLINKEGRYPMSSGEFIEVGSSGDIVKFRLVQPDGVAALQSTEGASALHRWELYWESKGSALWFNSSDVGMTVWTKNPAGRYTQTWISDQTPRWAAQMPEPFFDALPGKLKQQWGSMRRLDK